MIFLILFFVFVLLSSPAPYAFGFLVGKTAPDFTLNSIEGEVISLGEYKGQIVVLIYWRTEQKRSILALKDSNDMFKKFEGKGVNFLNVIAGDDSQEEAQIILKDYEIEHLTLIDSNRQLFSNYMIRVYPTTVIIDREGIIAHGIASHPLTYKNVLEGHIKKVLGMIDEAELKDTLTPHRGETDKASIEALRLYNLALKFTKSGMFDLAIETANKSIATKSGIAKSHILLGFLYLEQKEADKAHKEFTIALELDPDSKDAKTGLGGALILQSDIDSAIEILNSAAVANPYPQMTYYELGKAYELKGEKDKSVEMYKKAIEKIIEKQIIPSFVSQCK